MKNKACGREREKRRKRKIVKNRNFKIIFFLRGRERDRDIDIGGRKENMRRNGKCLAVCQRVYLSLDLYPPWNYPY